VAEGRVLVAGVGNIFCTDDGFGPEVARALAEEASDRVKIVDFGIRGTHLAYELLAGYDRAILIDAVPRGEAPGTVYVIEPDIETPAAMPDAHTMDLGNVFALARALGGDLPPVVLVGCEPAELGERIGLTAPVRAAIAPASDVVRRLIAEVSAGSTTSGGSVIWSEV